MYPILGLEDDFLEIEPTLDAAVNNKELATCYVYYIELSSLVLTVR